MSDSYSGETGRRPIRMDTTTWNDLAAAARDQGLDRSTVVRRLVRLYLHDPLLRDRVTGVPDAVPARQYAGLRGRKDTTA